MIMMTASNHWCQASTSPRAQGRGASLGWVSGVSGAHLMDLTGGTPEVVVAAIIVGFKKVIYIGDKIACPTEPSMLGLGHVGGLAACVGSWCVSGSVGGMSPRTRTCPTGGSWRRPRCSSWRAMWRTPSLTLPMWTRLVGKKWVISVRPPRLSD